MPYVIVKTRSYESVAAEQVGTASVYAGLGCFRVLVELSTSIFVCLSGILSLSLRVFMSREAIAHHRRTSMMALRGGVVWAIMVVIVMIMSLVFSDNPNQWEEVAVGFVGTPILWSFGLAGWLLSAMHELIANAYPDKVHGNGYGLANLIALLPPVRPMAWLTYAVELLATPVLIFVAVLAYNGWNADLMLANTEFDSATEMMIMIVIFSVSFIYPLLFALVWRHDYRFRHTD